MLAAIAVGAVGVFGQTLGIAVGVLLGLGLIYAGSSSLEQTFARQPPRHSRVRTLLAALLLGLVLFSGGTAAAWGFELVLDGDSRGYPALALGLLGAASIAALIVLLLRDARGPGPGADPPLPG